MSIGADDEPWGTFIASVVFSFGFVLLLAIFPLRTHIAFEAIGNHVVYGIDYITQPPVGEILVIVALVIFVMMAVFVAVMTAKEGTEVFRKRPQYVAVFLSIYAGAIYVEYTAPAIIPLDMAEVVLAAPIGIPMLGLGLAVILSVIGTLYTVYEKLVWVKQRLMT